MNHNLYAKCLFKKNELRQKIVHLDDDMCGIGLGEFMTDSQIEIIRENRKKEFVHLSQRFTQLQQFIDNPTKTIPYRLKKYYKQIKQI